MHVLPPARRVLWDLVCTLRDELGIHCLLRGNHSDSGTEFLPAYSCHPPAPASEVHPEVSGGLKKAHGPIAGHTARIGKGADRVGCLSRGATARVALCWPGQLLGDRLVGGKEQLDRARGLPIKRAAAAAAAVIDSRSRGASSQQPKRASVPSPAPSSLATNLYIVSSSRMLYYWESLERDIGAISRQLTNIGGLAEQILSAQIRKDAGSLSRQLNAKLDARFGQLSTQLKQVCARLQAPQLLAWLGGMLIPAFTCLFW